MKLIAFFRASSLSFFAATLVASPTSVLAALPQGLQVTHGDLQLSEQGNYLRINQLSQQAIANWQSFSIGSGQTIDIQQPGIDSVLLNRVLGADPSQLLGQLHANGRVYLINPNGVLVGPDAQINTAEFLASALDIADQDFLNGGDLHFSGDSTQSVVNLGRITATNGDVYLLAYQVVNSGEIHAPEGVAALAAGNEIVLTPEGDQRILVKTGLNRPDALTGVENSGILEAAQAELKAAGGEIYELAINQSGIIRATGSTVRDGRILLTADGGNLRVSGALKANNVDGSGGEILLGGDYRGANAAVDNAANTLVTADAVIDVSATGTRADAGRAIVWADQQTHFFGTIRGQGGTAAGDGAFAEVSGKQFLDFRGLADLRATHGAKGQLLLDPASLTIQATGPESNLTTSGTNPFTFGQTSPAGPSILTVATLENQLALSHVQLDTSLVQDFYSADGSIVVADAVSWTSGNRLTFLAGNSVLVNADLDAGSGDIVFALGFSAENILGMGGSTTGSLEVASGATVRADEVTIQRNSAAAVIGANPLGDAFGAIQIDGILDVNQLDIQYSGSGFGPPPSSSPAIHIENSANTIGTLRRSAGTGALAGDISIFDSSGGLVIDGSFASDGGLIQIITTGNLELSPGAQISTTGEVGFSGSDIYLAAQGGDFINNAGSNAVDAGGDGRFLIYSDNPTDTDKGGLLGSPVYNKTFAANAPTSITQEGDRFIYALAPVLTLTANPAARRVGEPNPTFTYAVSGLVGGDAEADVFSGDPALSSTADLSSPEGNYAIDINQGTVALSDFNYGLSLMPGILTIDPAALRQLIIEANDTFRFYGDENPAFTASFTGFGPGEGESLVIGLRFSTLATAASPIGNYTITPFGAAAAGFDIVYQPGNLRIDPRLLTVTADDAGKIFGDALPPLTATFSGLASFDTALDLGPLSLLTTASAQFADAGSYSITASGLNNPNYAITYVPGTATVSPRPVTITASDATREYGLANPAFTATQFGIFASDFNPALLAYDSAAPNANVGSYAIAVSGFNNPNYDPTYAPGSLSVTPATLTLTANSFSRQYGLENPVFTAVDSGLRLSDTLGSVLQNIQLSSPAQQGSSVGNYAITPTADLINSNYSFNPVAGQLEITKAPLFVVPALSSRFYGDPNPSAYELVATGLRNGDDASVVVGEVFQNLTPVTANAGSPATVSILAGTATNYDLSFGNGVMNILARPLTIQANSFTREYGDANPTFTASFDNLASFDNASVIPGLVFNTPATPASNVLAGGYGINPTSGSNPNYAITYLPGTLTITPAPLLLELGNTARFYGDSNITPTADVATGFKLGQTIDDLNLQVITTAVPTTDVGTYAYNATSYNPNYLLNITGGTLTINPAPISVIVNNSSRNYGDPSPTPSIFNIGGLKFPAAFSDIVLVTDPTTLTTNVGLYSFEAIVLNPNYTLDSLTGDIQILARPIDIVASASRFFGDFNPTPAQFTITGATVNDDVAAGIVGLSFSGIPGQTDNAGTYDITGATTFSLLNSNYHINQASSSLTIEARPINIQIAPANRLYGEINPDFSVVGETNIQPGIHALDEVIRFTVDADEFSVADIYPISAEIINSNYTFGSLLGENLVVSPRSLTVSINSINRLYGDLNPAFTAVFGGDGLPGFVGPEAQAGFFTTEATERSDIGNFFIEPSASLLDEGRYTLTSVSRGNLSILPRPITLRLDSQQRLFGDDFPVSATILSGSLPSFADLNDVLPSISGLVVNNYRLEDFEVSPNYALMIDPTSQMLSIIPRPLTVEVNSVARFFGDPNPTFSASFGGAGNNDYLRDQGFLEVSTVQATSPQSNSGFYLLNLADSTLTNPNFSFTSIQPGVLSVLPRPITVDVADDALVLDFGTDLDSLNDSVFAGVSFRAIINNVPAFVDLAEIAEGFDFEVSPVNVPFPVVEVIQPEDFVAPDVSLFEGRGNYVSIRDAGIPTSTISTAGPTAPTVSAVTETTTVTPILIGSTSTGNVAVSGTGESFDPELGILIPTTSTASEVTRNFFITLTESASENQNLVLSGITSGVLTVRARTNIEQISHDLNRAVELETASRTSLVIRAPSDYQGNLGLVFGDFPDMTVDMITAYFEDLLATRGMNFDEDSLFYSIFGTTFGTREDIDPATIRAWLSDISTNVEKRSFMGEVLFGYLQEVQAIDPLDRSPGQKILADAVAAKFQEERDATARLLLERKAEFDRNNLAAMSYYELKNDIETLKGRTAVVAQGFLDDKRASNGYTANEQLILEQLIATAGDVRDAAQTIELLDAWAAERRDAGRAREFVDDQIAGLRAELQEVQDNRTALRNIMQDESQTGYRIADSGLEALAGNFTPYSDFLAEVRLDALDAKLANYDIIGSIVGGAAGTNEGSSLAGTAVGLGAASATGFASATSYTRFVAPYSYRIVKVAGVDGLRFIGGGSRLAGPIGATLTAAITITDRAFQTFQEDEQRIIFEGLTEDIGKPVNFNDIDITSALDISDPDFDPTPEEMKAVIEREFFADALNSMLLGL